jgi:hypothetical protein
MKEMQGISSREHPERSAGLFRAQSKDAIPIQVQLGNRTLRLRPTGERRAPLRVLTLFREALMLLFLFISASTVFAQDELTLFVHRNFGYSGGSQIQGSFSMEAVGPENLASVTFKIDETLVGTVMERPFKVNFDTDNYPVGWHTLIAIGQTAEGQTLTSAPRRFEFVTADEGLKAAGRIVLPLLGVVGVVLLLSFGISMLQTLSGKKSSLPLGAARNYGLLGGVICPKCERPFSIHWWGFNILGQKFDRCDHCGQWSLVRRVSREKLQAAEAAEVQAAQPETPIPELSPEEKLKRQLDESRFDER